MPESRDRWLAARAAARMPRVSPSIDSCLLHRRGDGRLDIVVRGTQLRPGAVPAVLKVGGWTARHVTAEDATELRGVVDDGRLGDDVELDFGPLGRAQGRVEGLS
jgi:hypothetical protein